MNKQEIIRLQKRRHELTQLFNTQFRPSITDEGSARWSELLSIHEILNRIGK